MYSSVEHIIALKGDRLLHDYIQCMIFFTQYLVDEVLLRLFLVLLLVVAVLRWAWLVVGGADRQAGRLRGRWVDVFGQKDVSYPPSYWAVGGA